MRVIATQGCIHGDIDRCYESVKDYEEATGNTVDCILWSGDVQSVRNEGDLESLACPPKYRALKDFHKYYDGSKQAPRLTLFTGGNHEASAFIDRLYFGGWVAPNILYMGKSLVLWVDKWRIAGLSGVYKPYDYRKGYFEIPPFDDSTIRSTYHVREHEIEKLKAVSEPLDVCLTHDWPAGVIQQARDRNALIRRKPHFKNDLNTGILGSRPSQKLLELLQPRYWIGAHLHVNIECDFWHEGTQKATKFMAHDKPKNYVSTSYIDVKTGKVNFLGKESREMSAKKAKIDATETETPTDIDPKTTSSIIPEIDLEWLTILRRSFTSIPIGDETRPQEFCRCTRHTNWELRDLCRPDWKTVLEVAEAVDSVVQTNWKEELLTIQDGAKETDLIPPDVQLKGFRFTFPDWTVLKPDNPEEQTKWWLRLLGLDPTDTCDRQVSDWVARPDDGGNPLLE